MNTINEEKLQKMATKIIEYEKSVINKNAITETAKIESKIGRAHV